MSPVPPVRTCLLAFALAAAAAGAGAPARAARANPLVATAGPGQPVENCADPSVIRSRTAGDDAWYMVCTSDALGDWDRDGGGGYRYRYLPILRSTDLVHWTYVGDAVTLPPSWAEVWSNLWAPEFEFVDGLYSIYYAATDTRRATSGEPNCGSDSAIGVATSASPGGPYTHAASPVVAPRRAGAGCSFYATIDPEVTLTGAGQRSIYYGSFSGGIEVRTLSADGLTSSPASAVRVAADLRFEGPEVVRRDGWYYLLLSASTCCDGPASGYTVVAGRSASPTGPFVDREGVPLDAARAGGTPVLAATGNRWIGPGHNTVLQDLAGGWWTIYHAIEEADPYFAGSPGYTRRPPLLDPLDWIDGWPTVRGGWWVSDCPQPAPVAVEGGAPEYQPTRRADEAPGTPIPERSDEFDGPAPGPQWSWIRPPAGGWSLADGALRWETQAAELYEDDDTASILVEPAPAGDWIAETRLALSVPASGCCYDYVQAGLVVHGDDDNYLKLVHASIGGLRMTEWARERYPVVAGSPRYGKSWVGAPADWTWLRIVRRGVFDGAVYTAYTSADGLAWTRGASWRHALGANEKIGLVAMNRAGFVARFDFLRVARLAPEACDDPAWADPCDPDDDGAGDRCDPDDDGDGALDGADCAAADDREGRPPAIGGVSVTGTAPARVGWSAAPSADRYDVTRGALSALAPGAYGPCLADDLAEPFVDDGAMPAAGDGYLYLVRGVDAGCGGAGDYGSDSTGASRSNADPAACP